MPNPIMATLKDRYGDVTRCINMPRLMSYTVVDERRLEYGRPDRGQNWWKCYPLTKIGPPRKTEAPEIPG